MTTDSFAANTRLTSDDVVRSIESSLPTVDTARTQSYGQLALLRDAKARSLVKEQRLLTVKDGAANPRIAQAAAAFTANENVRREIAVVREVVETPAPAVDAHSFVVYGFVRRRSTQAGIPGLTVALGDEQGNWIKRFGYACTDQRGYFELTLKFADVPKELIKTEVTSVETGVGTNDTSTTSTASLILRIFDRSGRTLHTEDKPVVVSAGELDYRVILLDDTAETSGCTPPPAQTGGKPVVAGPVASQNPAAATPLKPSAAPAPSARVGDLKSYQPAPAAGQPLEAIRGIGPKTADKLRAAGIPDVAAFEKTPGQKLVDVAGFDKTPPKPASPTPEKATPSTAAKADLKRTTVAKAKRRKK